MKVARSIEILAWTVGVSLLVTYAAGRSWFAYGREQGIESFDALRADLQQQQAMPAEAAPQSDPIAEIAATEHVDMSTWSRERIAHYRATLHADGIPEAVLRIPSLNLAVPVFEGTSVESLGVDAWGCDFALIGECGHLVQNPYHYRDARTDGVMDAVFNVVPADEIYAITGIQFLPFNTLYQLYAACQATPKLIEASSTVLTAMKELGIGRGVYTSTLAVFSDTHGQIVDERYRHDGPWLSIYDHTKWAAHYEVAAGSASSSRARVRFGSSWIPGPMVVLMVALRM